MPLVLESPVAPGCATRPLDPVSCTRPVPLGALPVLGRGDEYEVRRAAGAPRDALLAGPPRPLDPPLLAPVLDDMPPRIPLARGVPAPLTDDIVVTVEAVTLRRHVFGCREIS